MNGTLCVRGIRTRFGQAAASLGQLGRSPSPVPLLCTSLSLLRLHRLVMAQRVAVVGGGLSGLTFAWALQRVVPKTVAITLVEASSRTGGWLFSHRSDDGFLFEKGCRGLRGGKPVGDGAVVISTMHELGMHEDSEFGQAVGNHGLARQRFIKHGGSLHAMPMSPAGLLSWPPLPSPLRMAFSEPFRPAPVDNEDETVRDFISRRLGEEAADNLVDAMAAGVWAGRIDELSAAAVFPDLVALEAEGGSLTGGFAKRALARFGVGSSSARWQPPLTLWFQQGKDVAVAEAEASFRASPELQSSPLVGATSVSTTMGTEGFVRRLRAELERCENVTLLDKSAVVRVTPPDAKTSAARLSLAATPAAAASGNPLSDIGSEWRPDGREIEADLVVSAQPSPALASALEASGGWAGSEVVSLLRSIPRSSVGVVCTGWKTPAVREVAGRRGFGFLSPTREDASVLGTVWDSCVFPHQAVEGRYLSEDRASVMMGGRRNPDVASWSPQQLRDEAMRSLEADTGVPSSVAPDEVNTWVAAEAIPQYTVGHLDRMAALQQGLSQTAPWMRILGNSYYGVGAAACLVNARGAAKQVADQLLVDEAAAARS